MLQVLTSLMRMLNLENTGLIRVENMEKSGWVDELVDEIGADWEAYSLKEKSDEAVQYKQGIGSTLGLLEKLEQLADVALILFAEKVILQNALKFYANSPEMKNSLNAGLEDLEDAQNSLKTVQEPAQYKIVKKAMSKKDIAQELPLDGFRKFERSHQARLSNLLKTTLSTEEKSLVRQRKNNLKAARNAYMSMQQKALGITQG